MALFTLSPDMSLPIPNVGEQPGPDYAQNINSCFTLIDSHDHTPGKGIQITTAGINIDADLDFNDHFLTNVSGIELTAQNSPPNVSTIYQSGDDLYFVDALGNNIQITLNGGIAGSPGSISNLVSPASASYVAGSSKFVWQSNTNIAANMDFGSAIMRNLSPNSTYALTLQPPAGLSSNFSLTLPILPGSTSFLTLDASGNIVGSIATANGITASNIAAGTITNTQISASAAIEATKLAAVWNTAVYTSGSTTWTVPAGVTSAIFEVIGGGGAGGGAGGSNTAGAANQGGGGGGAGEGVQGVTQIVPLTPAEVVSIVVGAGGTLGVGTALNSVATGTSGTAGGATTVTATARTITCRGGAGGLGGHGASSSNPGAGAGGTGGNSLLTNFFGGAGTAGGSSNASGAAGTAGQQTGPQFLGGAAGGASTGFSGGGGGGGGGGPSSFGVGQDGAHGGTNATSNSASATNTIYGSGGGGGGGGSANSTSQKAGGNGGPGGSGYVRITWWGPAS